MSTNGVCGRSGELPKGKILIPGVITHHTITVEHPGWSPIGLFAMPSWSARKT